MRYLIAIAIILSTSSAFAQQQQTAGEAATDAAQVVLQLGKMADQQAKQIQALQKQIEELQKKPPLPPMASPNKAPVSPTIPPVKH